MSLINVDLTPWDICIPMTNMMQIDTLAIVNSIQLLQSAFVGPSCFRVPPAVKNMAKPSIIGQLTNYTLVVQCTVLHLSFCPSVPHLPLTNKKVGKPYNAADARNLDLAQFGVRGGRHWWCQTKRHCVSELLYRPSIQKINVKKLSF